MMGNPLRPVLISSFSLFLLVGQSGIAFARGGGGCLAAGTAIGTPGGAVSIEQVQAGDLVLAEYHGSLRTIPVSDVLKVRADEIYELAACGSLLRATAEHPVAIAPGVFRQVSQLSQGDTVLCARENRIVPEAVTSLRRVGVSLDVYNLLVSRGGTYLADGMVVHNKGCFLPDTRIRRDDGTETPISRIQAGDRLLSFDTTGAIVPATVRKILTHEVDEYRIVRTDRMVLHVTEEHPFSIGKGIFKTVEALRPGDMVYGFDGAGWSGQTIQSIETVREKTRVWNVQTDAPHTYFANGIAVHNKGGGCFPKGTLIKTPEGTKPIEQIASGDRVIAISENGTPAAVRVSSTHATTSPLVVLQTERGQLITTGEHPLRSATGEFLPAGTIAAGDRLAVWRKGMLKRTTVVDAHPLPKETAVYNLTVEQPNTFVADGFVVHNKGGGGGGFRSSGGSRSGGGQGRPMTAQEVKWFFIVVGGFAGILIFAYAKQKPAGGELDHLYSRSDIANKSEKTAKLLQFIAKQDASLDPSVLTKQTNKTFLLLQKCWQEREYGPMKPLLMPDLFADHLRQIEGMRRNHEINMLEGLTVDAVDLVNVRYTLKESEREYTALITATARDHYLDDRTRLERRGDDAPAQFQEFWTFQYFGNAWLLREIEQTAESDILSEDNYFEQFTDKAMGQVYGETAGAEGPEGPWLEGEAGDKEQRIERLLNHLVRTDKVWARNRMLLTARSTFLGVMTAWESGRLETGLREKLSPELAHDLAGAMEGNVKKGITLEFRNLCVRKMELVLVRNLAKNNDDEFVARVRAHAQKVMRRRDAVLQQDSDVTAFEEYLTFGRQGNEWKLKELVAPEAGKEMVRLENVDEGSTQQMIEWYYQHKRAL